LRDGDHAATRALARSETAELFEILNLKFEAVAMAPEF
jgi:hypothetical protein